MNVNKFYGKTASELSEPGAVLYTENKPIAPEAKQILLQALFDGEPIEMQEGEVIYFDTDEDRFNFSGQEEES